MSWEFTGVLDGFALFATYWPRNKAGRRGSIGSILMLRVDADHWVGEYVKPVNSMGERGLLITELKRIELRWKRGPAR
jgi:hypothetical protein